MHRDTYPAIFIDKDGTLIENLPYNVNPQAIKFIPGVLEGLKVLQDMQFHLIIITNQPGIALGYFNEGELLVLENHLKLLLSESGIFLKGFYYCPHSEKIMDKCFCRKPQPGLLFKAAEIHDIQLDKSWMIGDTLDDVEAGILAGCKTIFVDNGNETEWKISPNRLPDHTCESVKEAADIITCEEELNKWNKIS